MSVRSRLAEAAEADYEKFKTALSDANGFSEDRQGVVSTLQPRARSQGARHSSSNQGDLSYG
jgi:hypothetical protein